MMNKMVRDSHRFARNATVPMTEKKLVKMVPIHQRQHLQKYLLMYGNPCCSQLHYLVIPTDIIGTPS